MSTAKNIYLAGAVRTPIGRYGGALAGLTPAELGAIVARESLRRAGLEPSKCRRSSGAARVRRAGGRTSGDRLHTARGVPETVPASTINQACGSGLKAIILAAEQIMLGRARAVLAGGVESMSRVPYFAEGVRFGLRMGDAELVDGMHRDGFLDPLSGLLMGQTAENLAREYKISREEQDAYALRSQQRAAAAIEGGRFDAESFPSNSKGGRARRLRSRATSTRAPTRRPKR
jgi:acetyl-CoA C-acetyltransferase